jgi:hypothetical protein
MWSNGNSFGASANNCLGDRIGDPVGAADGRWPVPAWKFGLRLSDDRGSM